MKGEERGDARLRSELVDQRAILAALPDIIYQVDRGGRIVFCATSAHEDLLRPAEELTGRRIDRVPGRGIGKRFRQAIRTALELREPQTIEYELSPRAGRRSFYEARIQPMEGDRCLVVIRNIDVRKLLEAQLLQAQKLEAIGQLAAGIAHEINTPTQYITDNVRFLQGAFEELGEVLALLAADAEGAVVEDGATTIARLREAVAAFDLPYLRGEIPVALEQSLEGLDRIARIVKAMKEFSHPGAESATLTDLNQALQSTVTVSRNEWKYVAELEMDLDPELPPVSCRAAELNQAFLNIIVNAAHAMNEAAAAGLIERGKLGIRTRRDGDWVEIRISDTGTGIPPAIQSRIFDPFFTTKDVGRGTGQGLAISRSVVAGKHGGTLEFETESGKGTTFVIRIPIRGVAGTGSRMAA